MKTKDTSHCERSDTLKGVPGVIQIKKISFSRKFSGFTLMELIVVISILAILGTISFLSIQNFYGNARDSVRVSDIKSIQKGLSIFQIRTGFYPLPENSIEVTVGGVILAYQGYAGDGISRIINTNKTPLDPKDITQYTYTVNSTKKKAQLMGYLESGDALKITTYNDIFPRLINQSYATTSTIDYKSRFVYVIGDKIGVLTDGNKAPIQESASGTMNLSGVDTTGYVAYFGGDTYGAGKSTGTGDILITQMFGALTNTIPCNPLSYSGYTITALAHNETKIFTKPLTITNGLGTGSLTIQCINGELDTLHAMDATNISCNTNFVNQSNACVPDVCGLTVPTNAESTATSQTITQNWTQNPIPGVCTFDCTTGYSWSGSTNSCTDITPPTITSVTTTTPTCNTVRFTINGVSDTVALHTIPYSFDAGFTWQSGNTKDYTSMNQTIAANQIKVRDAVGNIYTYVSSINGTSSSCAVNGVCDTATTFACLNGTTSISNVAGSCGANATWSCNGLNGGTNASCSKANPVCPTLPTFTALSNQSCNTTVASNSAQINSIPASTPVTISGGKYAISTDNSTWGTWMNGAGTINPGNYVKLQAVESANGNTSTTVTLTVWGGATRSWVATTGASGYWASGGSYWQSSGYWSTPAQVWVSSGYWEYTAKYWCVVASNNAYNACMNFCSTGWQTVTTSYALCASSCSSTNSSQIVACGSSADQIWVDTSHWTQPANVWVDTSHWVANPDVWISPYGCN